MDVDCSIYPYLGRFEDDFISGENEVLHDWFESPGLFASMKRKSYEIEDICVWGEKVIPDNRVLVDWSNRVRLNSRPAMTGKGKMSRLKVQNSMGYMSRSRLWYDRDVIIFPYGKRPHGMEAALLPVVTVHRDFTSLDILALFMRAFAFRLSTRALKALIRMGCWDSLIHYILYQFLPLHYKYISEMGGDIKGVRGWLHNMQQQEVGLDEGILLVLVDLLEGCIRRISIEMDHFNLWDRRYLQGSRVDLWKGVTGCNLVRMVQDSFITLDYSTSGPFDVGCNVDPLPRSSVLSADAPLTSRRRILETLDCDMSRTGIILEAEALLFGMLDK